MKSNRRKFLRSSAALATGAMVFPQMACTPKKELVEEDVKSKMKSEMLNKNIGDFGIQLWTLKDEFAKNPKGVLTELASFGYTQIEGFETDKGLWWGMTPREYQDHLVELGMKMVASHCNIHENFEMKVAQAASIGLEYLVCPWVGPQKSMEGWKKVVKQFNECGELCRKAGIKFAYHNHAYSFQAFTGMIPHDYLMENTEPGLVYHEMDIYWVVTGKADPIEYLQKYEGRFKLCHIKDRLKDAPSDQRLASCDLGTGRIDFPKILKVAKETGMDYFFVEQERFDVGGPMESAKVGAQYMKDLVFHFTVSKPSFVFGQFQYDCTGVARIFKITWWGRLYRPYHCLIHNNRWSF